MMMRNDDHHDDHDHDDHNDDHYYTVFIVNANTDYN